MKGYVTYLNCVKDMLQMLMNDTYLTRLARRETIQATKQCVSGATALTERRFIVQVQRFVFDELLGKLVPVLKPLLKVGLQTQGN